MNRRRVLIETSWNVKKQTPPPAPADSAVLIETSWNVKTEEGAKVLYSRGINRNIVECKDLSNVIVSIKSLVLIETSWNVKTCQMSSCL